MFAYSHDQHIDRLGSVVTYPRIDASLRVSTELIEQSEMTLAHVARFVGFAEQRERNS